MPSKPIPPPRKEEPIMARDHFGTEYVKEYENKLVHEMSKVRKTSSFRKI
jgi:hypothetical protein